MSGIAKQRKGYLVHVLALFAALVFGLLGSSACVAAPQAATAGEVRRALIDQLRSEEHTSELQSH